MRATQRWLGPRHSSCNTLTAAVLFPQPGPASIVAATHEVIAPSCSGKHSCSTEHRAPPIKSCKMKGVQTKLGSNSVLWHRPSCKTRKSRGWLWLLLQGKCFLRFKSGHVVICKANQMKLIRSHLSSSSSDWPRKLRQKGLPKVSNLDKILHVQRNCWTLAKTTKMNSVSAAGVGFSTNLLLSVEELSISVHCPIAMAIGPFSCPKVSRSDLLAIHPMCAL